MTSATSTVLTTGDRSFPWSGELPATWSTKPLKYLVAMNAKTLGETTNPETLLHYIDIGSVSSHGEISNVEDVVFEDAPSRARRIVSPGDVLISTVRTYLRAIAFCEQARENLICSTGFAVVTARRSVDPKFLFYWVRSAHFVDEIVSRSIGVSYPAINAAEIGNLPFPLISQKEQQQIAAFLDRKTAELDAVLALKERQLKLLAEKRQALISQAVTRGLDPAAPRKPSGIDWLGDVPKHWEVKRLKYVTEIISGQSPHESTYNTNGIGSVLINGPAEYSDTDFGETVETKWTTDPVRWAPKGCLLFCLRGSTTGRLNITHAEVSIGRGVAAIVAHGDQTFINYLMITLRAAVVGTSNGSTFPSVTSETLGNYYLALPPLAEQHAVVAYLDRETASLDGIAQAIRAQIEKMREYRQALISAVVTGKIDVRGRINET